MKNFVLSLLLPTFLFVANIKAQTVADPGLLAEINKIRAVDNHAHPLGYLHDGEKDIEFDIPESVPPLVLPVRLRLTNPEFIEAWRVLYGYKHNDFSEAHLRELAVMKRRVMDAKGDSYPAWVLDKLGIEIMLANRISLGRGHKPPRFRWVWYANELLFPLNNEEAKKSNPQREADFNTDERWLKDLYTEFKLNGLPGTLNDYVNKLVLPALEKRKREGALAVKFYAAYMRSLEFADVSVSDASHVYAKYSKGVVPTASEYKALQDYLFRQIALECGRLGLAVHIHVGIGAGGWFYTSTANPELLDSVVNDPRMRNTTFVLIHGGMPFTQVTKYLLNKPNVYVDFSAQTFLTSSRELSGVIRSWLEFTPEKVMFGTDAIR